jgi:hypothetical protein
MEILDGYLNNIAGAFKRVERLAKGI